MEQPANGPMQNQYEITLDWISALSLYKDEMQFLRRLIDRYYLEVVKIENLDEIREEVMQLQDLGHANETLLKEMVQHRDRLAGFIERPNLALVSDMAKTHKSLQKKMAAFKLRFNSAKQEIFGIAHSVLEKMKVQKK